MTSPVAPVVFRFGEFELDLGAYELRRQGRRVKLGKQPMDLLILLVQRPRQLVSRAEIAERLWGPDVFVDIETGVNTAISKVRQALRDTADRPAYVETVAGRGYRFIAPIDIVPMPVQSVNRSATPSAPAAATQSRAAPSTRSTDRQRSAAPRAAMAGRRGGRHRPRGRRPCVRRGVASPGRRERAARADDDRRPPLRERRARSRAGLPGARPHRRDQRLARPDRPRPRHRQGPDRPLQGHHQDGLRDRPGAGGRVPGRRDGPRRGRAPARHHHADPGPRPGARLVAGLRARDHQRAGAAAGRQRGDRGADPRPPVSGRGRGRGQPPDRGARGLRRLPARPLPSEPANTRRPTSRPSRPIGGRPRWIRTTRWRGRVSRPPTRRAFSMPTRVPPTWARRPARPRTVRSAPTPSSPTRSSWPATSTGSWTGTGRPPSAGSARRSPSIRGLWMPIACWATASRRWAGPARQRP